MPPLSNTLQSQPLTGPIIACVDGSAHDNEVAAAAAGLANALDRSLILFHVMEHESDPWLPADPLEWNVQRTQARGQLARLRASIPVSNDRLELEVAEGEPVQTICKRAAVPGAIVVAGAPGPDDSLMFRHRTGLRLLEAGVRQVMLIPAGQTVPEGGFGNIMVPLDGSSFSEAALVEAARIARIVGASLLLTHVMPEPNMTAFGPLESEDVNLRLQLIKRNEDAAVNFLERVRRRVADQGLNVRNLFLKGDARTVLSKAIADERPSLVVLSTRGQGSRKCHDLRIGGIAGYLLSHLTGPTLLVQPCAQWNDRPAMSAPLQRLPSATYAA